MSALGYPDYAVYGVSYGTLLGLELLRVAPEGLTAVVLDSIVPIDSRAYDTNGRPLDTTIAAVVYQCAADAPCSAASPGLEDTINFAGERLMRDPIPASATRGGIGVEQMVALFEHRNSISNPPNVTEFIPQIVTEFANGEATTYETVIGGSTRPEVTPISLLTPYIGQIEQDRLALAYAAAQAGQALGILQGAVESLLAQLSADSARPEGLSDLEQLLDDETSAAVTNLDAGTLVGLTCYYALMLGGTRDAKAIRTLVDRYVGESPLTRARALIAVMSPADVAAFFAWAERETGTDLASATGALDLAI